MGRFLKNTEIHQADQYSVRVPFGETGTRPTTPLTGQLRYNTTLDVLEIYANDDWQFFSMVGQVDVVKDVFIGDGSTTSFGTMNYAYDSGEEAQVLVFIGSVHQNPTVAYTFNNTARITFTSAPPNGHSIVILHNYASTDNSRSPYSLSILENLVAWYKFNVGITEAGSGVSVWADQSGNGNDVLQSNDARRPTNSGGVIAFNGSSDGLQLASLTLAAPFTFYQKVRIDTYESLHALATWSTADNSLFWMIGSSPNIQLSFGGGLNNGNATVGSFDSIACVVDGATSIVQVGDATETQGNAGTNTVNNLTIGNTTGFTLGGAISIKEMLVYSGAHDADTRAQVLAYLDSI